MAERVYLEGGPLSGKAVTLPDGVRARDGVSIQDTDCELFYARYGATRRSHPDPVGVRDDLPVLTFKGYSKTIATLNLGDGPNLVMTT